MRSTAAHAGVIGVRGISSKRLVTSPVVSELIRRNCGMRFEGEQSIPCEKEHLWHLLMDPEFLAVVIPGCGRLEQIDAHRYRGVISARIGPIESRFDTDFTLGEIEPPDRFRLQVMGQGAGGFVNSEVRIELVDSEQNLTLLRYRGETSVGGRLAAIGQRLIEAAAKSLIKKGFDDLRERVEEEARVRDSAEAVDQDGTSNE